MLLSQIANQIRQICHFLILYFFLYSFNLSVLAEFAADISSINSPHMPVIKSIEYYLNGEVIDDEIALERLKNRTEIETNLPLQRYQVRRSIESIYRQGEYEEITVVVFRNRGTEGSILAFQMTSRKRCGQVELIFGPSGRKDKQLSKELCQSILKAKPGVSYTSHLITEDEKRLKVLHQEHGFFEPRIYSRIKEEGQLNIDIKFHINAGEVTKIEQIVFSGNYHFTRRKLFKQINTKISSTYNRSILYQDIETLKRYYRQAGYLTIQIKAIENYAKKNNQINLIIQIQEGSKVIFSGVSNDKTVEKLWKEVIKTIKFDQQDNYSRFTLRGNARWIRQFYQQRGYLDPIVTFQVEKVPPIVSSHRDITKIKFKIETEPPKLIESITFVGNQVFAHSQLLDQITTRPRTRSQIKRLVAAILPGRTPGGLFNPTIFEQDRRAIERFYRQNGFNQVTVENDKVLDDEKKLRLTFICREMRKQVVRSIDFDGNTVFKDREIRQWLKVKPDMAYNVDLVMQDQMLIQSKYDEIGYIYATSEPKYDNGILHYQLEEGQTVEMGTLSIVGNHQTKKHVLIREFENLGLRQGEILSRKNLDKIKQRLFMLGLFNNVVIDLPDLRQKKTVLDVILTVSEKKTKGISLSGGYNPLDRLRTTVELVDYNLYGRNLRAGMKIRISSRGNLYEATIIEPWLIGQTIGTFRLFEDNLEEREDVRARGFTTNLAKRINPNSNLALQYKYQELQYSRKKLMKNKVLSTTTVSSLGVSFRRDNRDRFLDPQNGWLNEIAIEYAGGFIGGKASFVKFTTDHRYFRKIYGLVLASSIRSGYAEGLRSNRQNPIISFERFYAGGSTTVRGYAERSLGPEKTQRGDFFLVLNSELRFPIYQLVSGTLFLDAGNVWDEISEASSSLQKGNIELKASIGIGLRIDTPIGPIRFDYAYPFADLSATPKARTYLELGQAF